MRTASCCLVFFIRDCIRFCTNPVSALCRTAFSRRRGRFAFSQSSMRFAPGRPTRMKNNSTVSRPRSGQPGATPGVGLQPAVLPSLAPGRQQQINRTVYKYSRLFTCCRSRVNLPAWECAIFRSDGSRERGIAFPATSLLAFLVAQESKCPAGMRRPEKPRSSQHKREKKHKRPSAKDSTFKPTFLCNGAQPAGNGDELCERAGLRCGRLRPARPKGRKACLDYLTV